MTMDVIAGITNNDDDETNKTQAKRIYQKNNSEDTIGHDIKIDLTVQHTIVTRLLQEEDNLEIYWPESKITSAELVSQSNIILVPHSSIAIELASHGVPFITFQDSPFKYIADAVMSIGEITDEELLKICIEKQIEGQKNEEINSRKKEEKLSKLILSWLLWDSVVNTDDKLIDKSVDKSVTNEGIET